MGHILLKRRYHWYATKYLVPPKSGNRLWIYQIPVCVSNILLLIILSTPWIHCQSLIQEQASISDQSLKGQGLLSIKCYELCTDTTSVFGILIGLRCTLRSWVHEIFHIIEQSPRNWEPTVCQNVALTVFPTQNICHLVWKTLRTTLWCFFGLQSWEEGLKSKENYATDLSHSFSPF